MIVNITLKNYRSLLEETSFSLVADSSKNKESNVSLIQITNKQEELRLLNVSAIYGANASGKSNLFNGLFDVINFIGKNNPKAGMKIPAYHPFKFREETINAPIEFSIEFIGKDLFKYKYKLIFDETKVIEESLHYYPNKRTKKLFRRISPKKDDLRIHTIKLGADLNNKEIPVFENQTALSKFGENIPDKIITEVYIYLTHINVINACNSYVLTSLKKEVRESIAKDNLLLSKINKLLSFSDTKLNGIYIKEIDEKNLNFKSNEDDIPEIIKQKIIEDFKFFVFGKHNYYKDNKLVRNDYPLSFNEESNGTNILLALGGKLLQVLDSGGIIFVDELETSLHPYLSKLLVSLFQNKKINKKNSQLVFTTHDTNLLDRTLLRKDQIWITEKNEAGETELFSLQDFPDIRDDTPFDKWYLAGKFGGIPSIKSLESIFE